MAYTYIRGPMSGFSGSSIPSGTWNQLFGQPKMTSRYSQWQPAADYLELFKALHLALLNGGGNQEIYEIFEQELTGKKLEPIERLAIQAKLRKPAAEP